MDEKHLPSYDEAIKGGRPQAGWPPPPPPQGGRPLPPPPPPPGGSARTAFGKHLPWAYPPGYYCQKCANTGYKLKNGHQCRQCWLRFYANRVQPMPVVPVAPAPVPYLHPVRVPVMMPAVRQAYAPAPAAAVVRPGDPALGGYPCPECKGRGQVRFLLDKEPCTMCHGVGRVY
ncbi:AaceriAGR336Cp [[Ashbya] aceris (nom. inval.)]|nr:AaceriAGR336Cp [[Ashbya] aceris (nom. inval.)]